MLTLAFIADVGRDDESGYDVVGFEDGDGDEGDGDGRGSEDGHSDERGCDEKGSEVEGCDIKGCVKGGCDKERGSKFARRLTSSRRRSLKSSESYTNPKF